MPERPLKGWQEAMAWVLAAVALTAMSMAGWAVFKAAVRAAQVECACGGGHAE